MQDTFISDVKVGMGPISIYPPDRWTLAALIVSAAFLIAVLLVVFVRKRSDTESK